ncbi:hypothetical protein D9613_003990 [Agrocybe pediades]|uniref:Uncharacterized protein n=1 Tax=Agrocybe pediades TaxID=84607 RepID=A0A8H4VJQ3_9AGAR|nr:hypothetical protein D9613_003990 [Agrocybe pediades]
MLGPIISVNGFVFCQEHGEEFCHRCCYDHRMTNNYQVEEELGEEIEFNMAFSLDNRDSFNVYDLGAVKAGGKKSESYKCSTHNKVDCKTCFDWVGFITKQAKEAESREAWLKKREKYHNKFDEVD